MKLFSSGRRSSGVEQLIRNQQAAGSNPIAGSIKINKLPFLFPLLAQPLKLNCEENVKWSFFLSEFLLF
jgi:hypothetical protein